MEEMSEYINVDKLKEEFPHDSDWDYPVNTNSYVVELIDSISSINIVQCKECKHYRTDSAIPRITCTYHLSHVEPSDFCNYGERSE